MLLLTGIAEAQDYVQNMIALHHQEALLLHDASEYYTNTVTAKDQQVMKDWPTWLSKGSEAADKLARSYQALGPVSFQEWESDQRSVCDEFFLPRDRTVLDMMNGFASLQATVDSDSRLHYFVAHNKHQELVVFVTPLSEKTEFVLLRRYWTDLHKLAEIAGCELPSWYKDQMAKKAESLDDFLAAKGLALTGRNDAWGYQIVAPSKSGIVAPH
jgi:hypothetical protein